MRRTRTIAILLLLCAMVIHLRAATIIVSNTNDSGSGALRRQVLAGANDRGTINFAVTGTIALTSGELLVDKNADAFGSLGS